MGPYGNRFSIAAKCADAARSAFPSLSATDGGLARAYGVWDPTQTGFPGRRVCAGGLRQRSRRRAAWAAVMAVTRRGGSRPGADLNPKR